MVFRTNSLFEAIRVSDAMMPQYDGPSAHFQVLTGADFPKLRGGVRASETPGGS